MFFLLYFLHYCATWRQNSANKQPPNKGIMIKSVKCHFAALDVQDGGKSPKEEMKESTVTYKADLPRNLQVQR